MPPNFGKLHTIPLYLFIYRYNAILLESFSVFIIIIDLWTSKYKIRVRDQMPKLDLPHLIKRTY